MATEHKRSETSAENFRAKKLGLWAKGTKTMRDEVRMSWSETYEEHYLAPSSEDYEKAIARANQMRAEATRRYLGAPFRGLARSLEAVRAWIDGHTAHHRLT